MSKVLVFADPHIDIYKNHEGVDRLGLCIQAFYEMLNYAHKHKIKNLICPGDWLHSKYKIHGDVNNALVDLFQDIENKYDVIIWYVDGNHDQIVQNVYDSPAPSLMDAFAAQFKFLKCINNKSVNIDGNTWHGIPYYKYPGDLKKAIEDIEYDDRTFVVMHNTPKRIKNKLIPTDFDYDETSLCLAKFVLCGHIHRHQLLESNFLIVGSTMANTHLDGPEDKGFIVLDTETCKYKLIKLDYPKFLTVEEVDQDSDDYQRVLEKVQVTEQIVEIDAKPKKILKKYWKENSENKHHLKILLSLLN